MLTFWQLGEMPQNNYYFNPPLKAKHIIKAIIRIRLQLGWCWLEVKTWRRSHEISNVNTTRQDQKPEI